jgi:uncharacterized phage protein (TIGR02220 family)
MTDGWIKVHRMLIEHPRASDPNWVSVWLHLLLLATHKPIKMVFDGNVIELKPGQLITSRTTLSSKTKVHRSTLERILKVMENEQQIEQVTGSTSRLITITKWTEYQSCEQESEQRVSSERAASEPPVSTNKNIRIEEYKKEGEALALFPSDLRVTSAPSNPSSELKSRAVLILTYLNEKAGRKFGARPEFLKPIMKRLMEGCSVEEIQTMINREILIQGPHAKWLQPSTLFGTNFYGSYADRELPVSNKAGQPNPRNTGFAPGQGDRSAAIAAAARRQNNDKAA